MLSSGINFNIITQECFTLNYAALMQKKKSRDHTLARLTFAKLWKQNKISSRKVFLEKAQDFYILLQITAFHQIKDLLQ